MRAGRSTTLLLLLASTMLRAQVGGLLFDRLTREDGLPGNEVLALHQDQQGFIWIGTGSGLARHEGVRTRIFHHDRKDSTSLSNDQVNAIAESPGGAIWIGTANGLCRYEAATRRFSRHRVTIGGEQPFLANRVRDLWCEGDSVVWIGTEDGAFRLFLRTGRYERLTAGRQADLPAHRTSLRAFAPDTVLNGLWIATHGGAAFFDLRARTFHHHLRPRAGWNCLVPHAVDDVIPDGRGGVVLFQTRTFELLHFSAPDDRPVVRNSVDEAGHPFTCQWLAVDGRGTLWMSSWTMELFHAASPGSAWEPVPHGGTDPGALPGTSIKCFLETADGQLWFGTNAGIGILSPDRDGYKRLWRAAHAEISVLFSTPSGRILVGTEGHGLGMLSPDAREVTMVHFPGTPPPPPNIAQHDHVTYIGSDREGHLLAGTMLGLYGLDTATGTVQAPPAPWSDAPHVRGPSLSFALHDARGGRWLGCFSQGIDHLPAGGQRWEHWHHRAGADRAVPGGQVLCALEDRSGRLWFGANNGGGLYRVDRPGAPPVAVMEPTNGQEPSGVVRCLAEAPDGRIWIGTHELGIEVLDPGTGGRSFLTRGDGLPSDRIMRILFARDGTAWVTTDQGIAHRAPGAQGFTTLSLPKGLSPQRTAPGIRELPDGRIVFGVGRDLIAIEPARVLGHDRSPEVRITGLTAGGTHSGNSTAEVHLGHENRTLMLELGTVGPGALGPVQFAYRIPGLEENWKKLGAGPRLELNALPPGRHRIEVRAARHDADTAGGTRSILVVVHPPFWSTWWFRASVLAAAALVTAVMLRLYVQRRLAAQRAAFEREQAVLHERVRIAGDMHDDLGAGLSALKLRSEMALRVEQDPRKREQLKHLATAAGELINSMRQIIWTMSTDQSSLEDLAVYTTSYARQYCEQNGLHLLVRTEPEWPHRVLTSEQRRNVFLVVKEALHNVVKHAHAREVDLELTWNGGLTVVVQDDGVGLGTHAEGGLGNGMRNMRRRVEVLGGRFQLANGQGTRVEAHIPLHP